MKNTLFFFFATSLLVACGSTPTRETLDQLHLKKGPLIVCGPPQHEFGSASFPITAPGPIQQDFNIAVELLHSFEYDEAEKAFAKVIDEDPNSVMAYWGVAMCCWHPLWEPPSVTDLAKGSKAVSIAQSIRNRTQKEADWLATAAAYYQDWTTTDPAMRSRRFEAAMRQLHEKYPEDREAAVFYALALDASASPADKRFAHQRQAGQLLDSLYARAPNHPGIIHYLIHTYDYPGIAALGLPAARRYAEVAPSSAHALHMPSHIFTRLGLWEESIKLNTRSVGAARCYAQSAGIKGHWDEELHGLDYLVYAYLQRGDNKNAEEQVQYIASIKEVSPQNFKVAYTFAAAPCRMALENKNWQEAAEIRPHPDFPWTKFPWQEGIIHFTRLLGFAHTGHIDAAEVELTRMDTLYERLKGQKDQYKANQLDIQRVAGRAWIAHARGANKSTAAANRDAARAGRDFKASSNDALALALAKQAADMEDSTSKHPVTPGEVLPARELYADLLFELGEYRAAQGQYEAVLKKSPNRFISLVGAARSADLQGNGEQAALFRQQLLAIADPHSNRPELKLPIFASPPGHRSAGD